MPYLSNIDSAEVTKIKPANCSNSKLRIYNKGKDDPVAPSKFKGLEDYSTIKSHHYINDSGS